MKLVREYLLEFHQTGDPLSALKVNAYPYLNDIIDVLNKSIDEHDLNREFTDIKLSIPKSDEEEMYYGASIVYDLDLGSGIEQKLIIEILYSKSEGFEGTFSAFELSPKYEEIYNVTLEEAKEFIDIWIKQTILPDEYEDDGNIGDWDEED